MPFDPNAYLAKRGAQAAERPTSGGFNPETYLAKKKVDQRYPGPGAQALGLLGDVSNRIDSYTGAPTRAAIGAAQNADTPLDIPGDAFSAAKKQFGANPATAPTGKDLVKRAGVPDVNLEVPLPYPEMPGAKGSVNPAGVAGFGMDVAANPLNLAGEAVTGAKSLSKFAPKPLQGVVKAGSDLESFAKNKESLAYMNSSVSLSEVLDSLMGLFLGKGVSSPIKTGTKILEKSGKTLKGLAQSVPEKIPTGTGEAALAGQGLLLEKSREKRK